MLCKQYPYSLQPITKYSITSVIFTGDKSHDMCIVYNMCAYSYTYSAVACALVYLYNYNIGY